MCKFKKAGHQVLKTSNNPGTKTVKFADKKDRKDEEQELKYPDDKESKNNSKPGATGTRKCEGGKWGGSDDWK